MYKLLIVDDEEIEREGMAQMIPWGNYEIKMVGTAWNGVEAMKKIESEKPDIVLTDIKMPVMNGIELIQAAKKDFPNVEFVVLSGYGEYDFTSRAMEEGVRHYILKPCDEEKITEVLEKAKAEVAEKREAAARENQYQYTVRKLLPRAREQIFRNMLLGREQLKTDYQLFLKEVGDIQREVVVLAFRIEKGFDYLEQYVIGNIMSDLIDREAILLSASIEKNVFLLLDARVRQDLDPAVERLALEFKRFEAEPLQSAVSLVGKMGTASALYQQVLELLRLYSGEKQEGLISHDRLENLENDATLLVDYRGIRDAKTYEEIVFELYLALLKMELRGYTAAQKEEMCGWILRILFGEEAHMEPGEGDCLLARLSDTIALRQGCAFSASKEEQRVRRIFLAVYQHLQNPDMSIQFLSREVLFVNEDYFGRLFTKIQQERFSAFLERRRIGLTQRLLQHDPELKMARLAELVGYSPDGQYFSKVFRKLTGLTPTEYRDSLKQH